VPAAAALFERAGIQQLESATVTARLDRRNGRWEPPQ